MSHSLETAERYYNFNELSRSVAKSIEIQKMPTESSKRDENLAQLENITFTDTFHSSFEGFSQQESIDPLVDSFECADPLSQPGDLSNIGPIELPERTESTIQSFRSDKLSTQSRDVSSNTDASLQSSWEIPTANLPDELNVNGSGKNWTTDSLPSTSKDFSSNVFVLVPKSSTPLKRKLADQKKDETIVNLRNKKIKKSRGCEISKERQERVDSLKLKLSPVLKNLSQCDVKKLYTSTGMISLVKLKTYFPRDLLINYSPSEMRATVKELLAEQLFE